MSTQADTEQQVVERFSRRSLWVALIIVLLLGGFAFAMLAGSGLPGWTGGLVSIAIAVAVIVLGRAPNFQRAHQVLRDDELHRQSLALAQRDALIVVLVAQPVCATWMTRVPVSSPAALMACATVTLAAVVLLASVLLRDR